MSVVFISYRRQAAVVHARAVFERLRGELGPQQVFIDLDGIDVGVDFVDLIEEQLRGCRVLLALIGPNWASATDRQGRRRLDLSSDYVRLEIATALRRGIRVMPILIDGAEMPDGDALPDELKPLVRLNAQLLDFQRFDAEVERLVAAIRRVLQSPAVDLATSQVGAAPGPPSSDADRDPVPVSPTESVPLASSPQPPAPALAAIELAGATTPEPVPSPAPTQSTAPRSAAPVGPTVTEAAAVASSPTSVSGRARSGLRGWPWLVLLASIGAAVLVWTWMPKPDPPNEVASSRAQVPSAAAGATADVVRAARAVEQQAAKTPTPLPTVITSPPPPPVRMARAAGEVFRDCEVCPEMVVISAGSFLMGSPGTEARRNEDEGPQRTVTLKRFALGKTEVTQAQWIALMGSSPSKFQRCGTDCPVENVSWLDVQQYLQRLNARTGQTYSLPSEAQWEYAARAGTATPYHTGRTISPTQANFASKGPVKVGSFAANGFGLHDMHGNVWEWVLDCSSGDAPYDRRAPSDGTAFVIDRCGAYGLRGGGWDYPAWAARSANRAGGLYNLGSSSSGFRVSRASPDD